MRYVESITKKTYKLVSDGYDDSLSKGGMLTKLRAAHSVSKSGASVVIADGRKSGVIASIMRGEDIGTFVVPSV